MADEENFVRPALARPYTWTRGRTQASHELRLETLLQRAASAKAAGSPEHDAVLRLCWQTRSVAEVSALLRIPLGAARVVLADMIDLGLLVVHGQSAEGSRGPDAALMERVLSGLRRI